MHSLNDPPTTAPPTRSAVIVPIPAAEHAVAHHRAHLDRAAGWGVPAHLTVLYPFLPPSQLNEQALTTLATAIATVASFGVTFSATAWFGSEVLWLAPVPEQPLRQLTAAVFSAFPDHPPYGGAHGTDPADVQPHLTVAERALAGPDGLNSLRAAEADVRTHLPVSQHLDHALLITGSEQPRSWRTLCRLELGNR